mgnify:FL=1
MGVDHRRTHVGVAEQFVDRANVVAPIEQVTGERMAQRVWRGRLVDAGSDDRLFHRALQQLLVQMMKPLSRSTPLRGSTE